MPATTEDWTFIRSLVPPFVDTDWLGGALAAVPANAIIRSPATAPGKGDLAGCGLELMWLPYSAAGVFLGGILRTDNSNFTIEPLLGMRDRLGAEWVVHGNNTQQVFVGWEGTLFCVLGLYPASGCVLIPRVSVAAGPMNPAIARADLYYRVRAGQLR